MCYNKRGKRGENAKRQMCGCAQRKKAKKKEQESVLHRIVAVRAAAPVCALLCCILARRMEAARREGPQGAGARGSKLGWMGGWAGRDSSRLVGGCVACLLLYS